MYGKSQQGGQQSAKRRATLGRESGVLAEALEGEKDDDTDQDRSIEMSELGEYVKKRVAELTNNKQTPNTRRVNLEGDFILAKTK